MPLGALVVYLVVVGVLLWLINDIPMNVKMKSVVNVVVVVAVALWLLQVVRVTGSLNRIGVG